jgi:hypothetical protein
MEAIYKVHPSAIFVLEVRKGVCLCVWGGCIAVSTGQGKKNEEWPSVGRGALSKHVYQSAKGSNLQSAPQWDLCPRGERVGVRGPLTPGVLGALHCMLMTRGGGGQWQGD